MNSPMQTALGDDFARLPAALRTHYQQAASRDSGWLDITFPGWMRPWLGLLHRIGALVPRRGNKVTTTVDKEMRDERQYWQRTMRFADGQTVRFDSVWEAAENGTLIEYVNPVLGLQMQPYVVGDRLHYRGVRFVARLGRWRLPIPEALALGHTRIVEQAIGESRFAMDFRLTHPWFGEVFCYRGEFETTVLGDGALAAVNPEKC
jgi:hypothetical protein